MSQERAGFMKSFREMKPSIAEKCRGERGAPNPES